MKSKMKKYIIFAVVVLIGAAMLASLVAQRSTKPETIQTVKEASVPVVVTPIRQMMLEDRVDISGNVEAVNSAVVSARVAGTLEKIFVNEGDFVEAGKTALFQTDSVNLHNAVEVARQELEVAKYSLQEVQARREQIVAQLDLDEGDLRRFKALSERNVATEYEMDAVRSRYLQSKAGLKHVEALVALSDAKYRQVQSHLKITEKNLADSLVIAPISGRISSRLHEPGEMVDSAKPVMRVDDLSVLEICAYLPSSVYSRIESGKTFMRASVSGCDLGRVIITYKSPTIDPKLRTFEIKAVVKNPPPAVVPGAIADISVILDEHKGLVVARESVVRRGGGLAIFIVNDNTAHMHTVKTGLENDGCFEVLGEGLAAGMRVVNMGQEQLNDGTAVREIAKEGR